MIPPPVMFSVSVASPFWKLTGVAPRLSWLAWPATVELRLKVRFALLIVDAPVAVRVSVPVLSLPPLPTCTCAVPVPPLPMANAAMLVALPVPPMLAPRATVNVPVPNAEPLVLTSSSFPLLTVVLNAPLAGALNLKVPGPFSVSVWPEVPLIPPLTASVLVEL